MTNSLPILKQVFWFEWLRAFIGVVALLITIFILYMAHVFGRSVLIITKIIVIEGGVHQVYICGKDIGGYLNQLLIATIALDFSKVLT